MSPTAGHVGRDARGIESVDHWAAVKRPAMDTTLVVVLGYAVFWLKQRFVHRRAMIV